jgi:hypothetical protein
MKKSLVLNIIMPLMQEYRTLVIIKHNYLYLKMANI